MKKVSKKAQSAKLDERKYSSLNGDALKNIKGAGLTSPGSNTDRVCGCGNISNMSVK